MKRLHLLLICILTAATGIFASAQDLGTLQERMRERLPRMDQLRQQQVVGEGADGYLHLVAPDKATDDIKKLVEVENADRKELYGIFSKRFNQTIEQAAIVGAKNFQDKAAAGTRIQDKEGKWGVKK